MKKIHEMAAVAIIVSLSAAPALGTSPAREVSLKEAADYALAESGAKREPAWAASDELASVGGRRFAMRVLNDPKISRSAGDRPIAEACGVTMPADRSASMRLLDSAAVLRMDMNPNNVQLTDQSRRETMVAMNRIEAHSQGYADGTRDMLNLLLAMSPETKAKFCNMVRAQLQ